MSCDFKPTSVTLLQRIAIERTGEDEATRVRFWELYQSLHGSRGEKRRQSDAGL